MDKKTRVKHLIRVLKELYPEPVCTLDFETPLQLLVATQLAAQCTDERVNIVCRTLFLKYRSVEDFAAASIPELEEDIRSTGFYHNKAKNLKACGMKLLTDFGGVVPHTMEELLSLPGVGRKTANVVLGTVFHIPGVIVDTHAGRLSRRMGLTQNDDPVLVEQDLMKVLPKREWTDFSHRLVAHGRAVCQARKPQCEKCAVRAYCEFGRVSVE